VFYERTGSVVPVYAIFRTMGSRASSGWWKSSLTMTTTKPRNFGSQGIDVSTVKLDVTDQSTIDAAALEVEKKFGKLDILVNNDGIGIDTGKPSSIDIDVLYRTYNTNVFGPFCMIRAFLSLLKKSEAGRIVNMSSGLGSLERNSSKYWETSGTKLLAYNSSKSALNAICDSRGLSS
jgi:NAD(P)-dependent dehydrogenase (short-subunit alcohol dehydrogenase family)